MKLLYGTGNPAKAAAMQNRIAGLGIELISLQDLRAQGVEIPDVPKWGYLAAYSGQIGGRSDWEDFVPAVFDYLQPDGYVLFCVCQRLWHLLSVLCSHWIRSMVCQSWHMRLLTS